MAETKNWLALTEYSSLYEVSISTLRRRIRSGRVEHKYSNGKYLLRNAPLSDHRQSSAKANPLNTQENTQVSAPPQKVQPEAVMKDISTDETSDQDSPVLTTAHRLLSELKKAYSLVLQEKEEQVLILKDEVADLQTLVRVLEGDNQRLKQELKSRLVSQNEQKTSPMSPIQWEETELELDI